MGSQPIHKGTTIELTVPTTASGLFAHKSTRDILSVLTDNPYESYGIRELARATNHPHRSISSAVAALETAGLVVTSHDGPKKLVGIDRERVHKPDDPILQIPQIEFHPPVRTLVELITDELENLLGIVLFGSVARGEADRRSDVDCFVLVERDRAVAQRTGHELASRLGEMRFDGDRYEFHILVESLESADRYGDRLREIFANGITLVGSDELATVKTEVLTDGR